MLLKTKDRKNEQSQTKPNSVGGEIGCAEELLSSAELSDLTPSPHYRKAENRNWKLEIRKTPSPPAPLPQRGEGRVSSGFSCPRPLWGRGRRGAPGEGVQVSPYCAELKKRATRITETSYPNRRTMVMFPRGPFPEPQKGGVALLGKKA